MPKYIVTITPWPSKLPKGTEIKPAEPRISDDGSGFWFTTMDEKKLFDSEPDNKFKLFPIEFESWDE